MKSLYLFVLFTCLSINTAFAQTPDDIVSSFFQNFNQPATVAVGALQKAAAKPKPNRELTPMLMFAKANWDTLSANTQSLVNAWFARPDDSVGSPPSGVSFFGSSQVISTVTSANFVFHYLDAATYSTDPNRATTTFVNQLAAEAEVVWAQIVNTMGYNAPPSDVTKGGNNKYDIYLINTGSVGIYGYVTSDAQSYLGAPYLRSVYSHMVVDNDFTGFPQAPLEAAKVTFAHEFFHSIQFGYDPTEFAAF
ncbi:MAG TPA: hypothetical protein EYP39_08180, partial [Ghiorsea sp.]|nr:hypothetical protein [Ghiorsea sp.]